MNDPGRILAVDPGDKRLGIAISDPTRTIASPLSVLDHQSREEDALAIHSIALEHQAALIIIGVSLDSDGEIGHQGRKSVRLKNQIRAISDIKVELWDEYGTTQKAQKIRRKMGVARNKRTGHLDELSAAILLQSFLDAQSNEEIT